MTLNGKIILTGKGLHSGQDCTLTIEPCNSPEILMRSGENELPLRKLRLSGTNRGSDYIFTSPDGTRVRTCEHVLSALAGLGIWSGVRLTVSGGEMPALDGCSRKLCDELRKVLGTPDSAEAVNLSEAVCVYGEDRNRFVAALPYEEGLRITYMVEYKYIGAQVFEYVQNPESYYREISCARTFAMQSDIDYLRSHGMALGGSLDNAIVIGETIQAKGGLHWPDEFVRHKVLDILGDLAAVGKPLNAHIIAVKAGHELHLKLAEKLRG
ncbi:MAG: UDP-3-O-acyl-N-acetylglucosamine deacetylase [Synergistaceae bacterium]|nr:UDP-3-O-acyl-N-acetylglucosamine deacetylase [Synergistaceae bacterium]